MFRIKTLLGKSIKSVTVGITTTTFVASAGNPALVIFFQSDSGCLNAFYVPLDKYVNKYSENRLVRQWRGKKSTFFNPPAFCPLTFGCSPNLHAWKKKWPLPSRLPQKRELIYPVSIFLLSLMLHVKNRKTRLGQFDTKEKIYINIWFMQQWIWAEEMREQS